MFLPIRTEAHDGRIRLGSIGILLSCLLVHILVTRDMASRAGGEGVFESAEDVDEKEGTREEALAALKAANAQTLFYKLALVSGDFNPLNLLTHQFVHGDWMHLIFNLWFFYIVGVTMEKFWGMGRFFAVYLGTGVLAALGFMLLNGSANDGVPMVGASGAIAGMMGAFAMTHGDAKVQMIWIFGFRIRFFAVPAKWYLGFWVAGQIMDTFLHSGQGGGVAFGAHVAGFMAGLAAGKYVPGDSFYEKAYEVEFSGKDVDRLAGPGKLDIPKPEAKAPTHQDGGEVITLLNRGMHNLEHGESRRAGEDLFLAMEKALTIPGLPAPVIEQAVTRILDSVSRADFPPGAVYAWGRKLEQKDWWQWAIRFYDAAAADFSPGTGAHSRNSSLLRAAGLRLDHNHEKELGREGLRRLLGNDPEGPFAVEAKARLTAV